MASTKKPIPTPFSCAYCGNPSLHRCKCATASIKCDHTATTYGPYCDRCCRHVQCADCNKCRPQYLDMTVEDRDVYNLCKCPQCVACGVQISGDNGCDCCDAPYIYTQEMRRNRLPRGASPIRFCRSCCGTHSCCNEPVVQTPRALVFWAPTIAVAKAEFPYEALDSMQSEQLLGGTMGSGKLNLRLFREHTSRRFASVELEVSEARQGKAVNTACSTWSCSVVHDGSINRDTGREGFEINSSPACGGAFTAQLKDLCNALEVAEATVNHTCGLHVHVDARDFGYQEIQRLLRVYVAIEPALFASVNPDRRNNRYCRRCGPAYESEILNGVKLDTKSVKEAVVKATYGRDSYNRSPRSHAPPMFYEWRQTHRGRGDGRDEDHVARYYAFNIHTWFRQGTVESRLHQGTVNFDEIYGWAKLHIDFVDAVAKTSDTEIRAIVDASMSETETYGVKTGRTAFNQSIGRGLTVVSRLLPPENFEYLRTKVLNQLAKER